MVGDNDEAFKIKTSNIIRPTRCCMPRISRVKEKARFDTESS